MEGVRSRGQLEAEGAGQRWGLASDHLSADGERSDRNPGRDQDRIQFDERRFPREQWEGIRRFKTRQRRLLRRAVRRLFVRRGLSREGLPTQPIYWESVR